MSPKGRFWYRCKFRGVSILFSIFPDSQPVARPLTRTCCITVSPPDDNWNNTMASHLVSQTLFRSKMRSYYCRLGKHLRYGARSRELLLLLQSLSCPVNLTYCGSLLLVIDWCMSPRRSLLAQAHQTSILTDYPSSKRVSQPSPRPRVQVDREGAAGGI